jgi:predicted nucleic acid-binding protein
MNAIDTNILICAVDNNEPARQGKAQTLIGQLVAGSKPTVLLWQLIVETVKQLRRWQKLGELNAPEFEQHVKTFRNLFPLSVPSLAVLDHALDSCRLPYRRGKSQRWATRRSTGSKRITRSTAAASRWCCFTGRREKRFNPTCAASGSGL